MINAHSTKIQNESHAARKIDATWSDVSQSHSPDICLSRVQCLSGAWWFGALRHPKSYWGSYITCSYHWCPVRADVGGWWWVVSSVGGPQT